MPDTAMTLSFAGCNRLFWLPMPQVIELERRCEHTSVFAIYERIGAGCATCLEVSETIRLGLIGASRLAGRVGDGVGIADSHQIIDAHTFPSRPLAEDMATAWAIMHAAVGGIRLSRAGTKASARPQPLRKGQVIANAGALHLDWERLSLSSYFEAVEVHNEPQGNQEQRAPGDPERLRRFVDAHRGSNGDKLAAVMKARLDGDAAAR